MSGPPRAGRSRALATSAALVALSLLVSAAPPPRAPRVSIVFVSRAKPATPGVVPGLGPRGRALATGGRLMVLEPGGKPRPLLEGARLYDVSDPCVSWDGTRVAFAATVHPDSAWRIWVVDRTGGHLTQITRTDRALDLRDLGAASVRFARYDDFDPCWLPDGRICFASTRWPEIAQQGGEPASNLYTVNADGTGLSRLTSERNGADEPTVDPASGRIVYARWFTNRWLPSERDPSGLTLDRSRALRADTVDVWHALSVLPDGDGGRLAGGDPRGRASVAAYQPLVLADGTLIGVRGEHLALDPAPGALLVQSFAKGIAPAVPLAGAGRQGASACSPAALPGGGLVLAIDRDGRGDYGLWTLPPGDAAPRPLVDLPGTLELDPAPLAPRARPPVASAPRGSPLAERPYATLDQLRHPPETFRFDCLNVFATGGVDTPFPPAPPIERGVKIRFYATLSRPNAAGGDTAVLLREADVEPGGGVHVEDLPGDTPMFEQLVGADGRVLRSAMSPAHVPGLNFARAGTGTKCVGCHAGHSALPVPTNYSGGRLVNVAPSARVTASSGVGAERAVDRRARGNPDSVAWIAGGADGEWLALRWNVPIEVSSVVLYPCGGPSVPAGGPNAGSCEITLFERDREVRTARLPGPLSGAGSRLAFRNERVDRIELRPRDVTGKRLGRRVAALAEVEIIARISEE